MPAPEPLFPSGIIESDLEHIKASCVDAFGELSTVRKQLFSRFQFFIQELAICKADLCIWIDGSFVTTKINPGDIDIIIWLVRDKIESLPVESQQRLSHFLRDHDMIRLRYHVDVYCAILGDLERRLYWRKWYGTVKGTENPKGILQIVV